jgi:hypothetical protein
MPAPASVDELYAVPLDEFVRERNALAAQLRKDGRREEADEVKGLQKPNAAAWALNRLAHGRRAEVAAFLEAAVALREAQIEADRDIREDKLERREAELVSLEERLARRERELATYVGQLQGAMQAGDDSEWWAKQLGTAPA